MTIAPTCPVVGLVGGVACGKSLLARRVAERCGLAVVDGDAAGHAALALASVRDALRSRFGAAIFAADGSVDRHSLADRVFGPTQEQAAALADLERMTHPVIRQEFKRQIAAAYAEGASAVLLDAAVLLEAGWQDLCDAVVFVDVPEAVRLQRAVARGWTERRWRQREAAQMSLREKRALCHAIVSNIGPPEAAADELAATLCRLCQLTLLRPATIEPLLQ